MKHKVSLTVEQVLGENRNSCPYVGCRFCGDVCESDFYIEVEKEYLDGEVSLTDEISCDYCDVEDEICPCGGFYRKVADVDEYNGKLYGYYYECSNPYCFLE